jgi:UDP-N-acetylmuramate: L-alanyl-gamma-D-glutamyl-meso-diaminopimelate ligase
MLNLALAISKKNSFLVTGSDEVFDESVLPRLKSKLMLPEKEGWFPERIQKGLTAVVLGRNVKPDNPELVKAKSLGLKIYSFPDFLFQQTRSKTRIVVAGTHGKAFTAAIILYMLKKLKIDADYLVSKAVPGLDAMAKLSYEARVAVFEGDEHPASVLEQRPEFHLYKPHIVVLTGVDWHSSSAYPTFETYAEQFREFVDLMEAQGRLIYNENDETLKGISEHLRRDIVAFAYKSPVYEIHNGTVYLKTRKAEVPLAFASELNLQCVEAARMACRQVGVTDDQFYTLISEFSHEDME